MERGTIFILDFTGATTAEADVSVLPAPAASVPPIWLSAVRAAEDKKASDILVLDLREVTSLTDFFLICTGSNPKQNQAICDEVGLQLGKIGERAICVEGYQNAEWILADFGDLLLHVFSDKARQYYDLERLWKHARRVQIPAPEPISAEPNGIQSS